LDVNSARPFDAHAAREAWLAAAWRHGDKKAQRVAQMCCWNNVVEDMRRLPEKQRLAMLTDFFSAYPVGGERIARALDTLGTMELFVPNKPLAGVAGPIMEWAGKQGMELEGVDRILWEPPRMLGGAWQARHVQARQSMGAQAEGNTYLQRLDDILTAVVASRRADMDRIGRLALQDVRLIAQRALWDMAVEEDSGWGHLLEVVFMGFWPCGVTPGNVFVVSHRPTLA
jgi:hypothetical protein